MKTFSKLGDGDRSKGARRAAALAVLALAAGLTACAELPEGNAITIRHVQVDKPTLHKVCRISETVEPNLGGCFRWQDDVCYVYTLPRWLAERVEKMAAYHITLGHEFDHCEVGYFHGQPRAGVYLPGQFSGRVVPWLK